MLYHRLKRHSLKIGANILLICCVYVLYCFLTDEGTVNPVKTKYVAVHIDLKGAPPKLSFLKSMLVEIKSLGANALLIEYEDTFPYEKELSILRSSHHYTKNELRDFLIEARNIGFEVIPLIQTFGHMEFVLKHKPFKKLSETNKSLDSICPSKPGSLNLIDEMLRQVINFHIRVVPLKHIHIGCDEVYHLNKCPTCKKRRMSKHQLYFNHVNAVSTYIKKLSPKTKILIWDDMLRTIKPYKWKDLGPYKNLEIVYWEYQTNIKPYSHLYFYHQHFENIWIAAAFKGADGNTSLIPDVNRRMANVLDWLYIMQDYVFAGEKQIHEFEGIFLTGWSRYNHFSPLCDLLAMSYESLIMSLVMVNRFRNGAFLFDMNSPKDFNKNFVKDYYSLLGNDFNAAKRKDNILRNSMSLSESLREYTDYLRNTKRDIRLTQKKNLGWCLETMERLRYIEEVVLQKMETFYTLEVSNAYIDEKGSSVRDNLNDCINYLKTTTLQSTNKPKMLSTF